MIDVILRTDHHIVELQDDGTVIEWRTGEHGKIYASLQEYYMSLQSPIQRWSNHCENILKAGGEVMDALSLLERLLIHVLPVIESTEPGAIVQGTRWTKEQCAALLLLAGSVKTFVQTPIECTNSTPAEEISKYA